MKQVCLLASFLFSVELVLDKTKEISKSKNNKRKRKKRNKSYKDWKQEAKLSLFTDGMIVCTKIPVASAD